MSGKEKKINSNQFWSGFSAAATAWTPKESEMHRHKQTNRQTDNTDYYYNYSITILLQISDTDSVLT